MIEDFSTEEIARAIRVNLEAPMLMSQALDAGDEGAGRRPPRLRLVALRQGRLAARLDLQRDQVRPARLRARRCARTRSSTGTGIGVSLVLPGFIRDAGMFADGGAKLPPGAGTGTPEQVGAAVVKAIDRRPGRDRGGPAAHAGDLELRPRLPADSPPAPSASAGKKVGRPARPRQRRQALSPPIDAARRLRVALSAPTPNRGARLERPRATYPADREHFGEASLGEAQAENAPNDPEMLDDGERAPDADEELTDVPALEPVPTDATVDEAEEAAAAEAGAIGGDPGEEGLPEAERPLAEAGEGEAEGFELAEEELIESASHGDPVGQPAAATGFTRRGRRVGGPCQLR